jgi:hypothetical protein
MNYRETQLRLDGEFEALLTEGTESVFELVYDAIY